MNRISSLALSRRTLLRVLPMLCLALALVAGPSGAGAASAQIRVTQLNSPYVNDDSFPSCDGSYTIAFHSEGRYHETDYFDPAAGLDANGDPIVIRVQHHDDGRGSFTNPANGKTLAFSYADQLDERAVAYNGAIPYPAADSGVGVSYTLLWRERGIPIKLTLPTGKVISIDDGLIVTPDVQIVLYYVGGQQREDILSTGDAVVHGPHPLYNSDRFCQLSDQYLK
jgi:hypothetical protein